MLKKNVDAWINKLGLCYSLKLNFQSFGFWAGISKDVRFVVYIFGGHSSHWRSDSNFSSEMLFFIKIKKIDKIGFCQASADWKTFTIHYKVHWSCESCRIVWEDRKTSASRQNVVCNRNTSASRQNVVCNRNTSASRQIVVCNRNT